MTLNIQIVCVGAWFMLTSTTFYTHCFACIDCTGHTLIWFLSSARHFTSTCVATQLAHCISAIAWPVAHRKWMLLLYLPFTLVLAWRCPHSLSLLLCFIIVEFVQEEEDLRIDRKVRCKGAYHFWPVSRRGLDPIKLTYTVSQYASSRGNRPTATHNLPFLPRRWPKPSPVHIAPIHRGWPGWVGLSGLDLYRDCRPQKVTNPSINPAARPSLTLLMWPTSLSLRQSSHQKIVDDAKESCAA